MVSVHRHVLIVLTFAAAACSSGDGTDIGAPPPSVAATGADPTRPPTSPGATDPTDTPDTPDAAVTEPPGAPSPPTFAEVPETGVPGLDSPDEFCAAWSRFGGSFQVVAVNAAFGEGSVADRAVVEVAAGPTVATAIADLAVAWPEELAAESETALVEVFGPFADRVGSAEAALVSAGATPEQLTALSEAWMAFLAQRDPADPAVALDLDDEVSALVLAAVPAYLDEVGTWDEDESLVTDASIPATEAYLASECPDQGALAGQEVG